MGEIDTKPIESVQTVISYFGQTNEQKKNSPIKDEEQELKKESEVESLEKEVANIKVQMEAKDNIYKQALVMIDHLQKTADDLSILLNKSDLQKDFYINESREAKMRIKELESALEQSAHCLSESQKAQQQLMNDLESKQNQLMNMETEHKALERALKLQNEELVRQSETMHDLENRVMEKSAQFDSLEMELQQLNMLHVSSEKVASNAIFEANKVREEMEAHEKTRLEQAGYIDLLETEVKQLRIELEHEKTELEKSKEQENEGQVEIAMLKFELHKGRAKLAAAEAAETRAQAQKSALYNALQQMGLEAEEMNKENRLLKESMQSADECEIEETVEKVVNDLFDEEMEKLRRDLEVAMSKMGELRTRAEQAMSRADAAEKAKAVLEEQIRKRKDHKMRRRAALAALREESVARSDDNTYNDITDTIKHDTSANKSYQPLGKVLNMKF